MTTPEENIAIVTKAMLKIGQLLSDNASIYNIKELSDNIEWYFCSSPDSPYVGRCIGKSALEKTLRFLRKTTINSHLEPGGFVAQDNKVVATGWERFQFNKEETGDNRHMAYNNIWIFTLTDDGIILKCEQMYNMALEGMFGYPGDKAKV